MTPIEPVSLHTERSLELRAWILFAQGFAFGAGLTVLVNAILARLP